VPEIIRFSNELCYSGSPLIPLRQVPSDRLPALRRTYVGGLRRGDVNEDEAEAIVQAVKACHDDPAYEDADFGVICLQGEAQAQRIQGLLLDRLGPDVFHARDLRCGNPHAFQGDERDVMFLSMVAAPNVDNASLTTRMYEQRFNVAMSRARDQAWLFHSIREDELGPNCLRRRVLQFFREPPNQTINGVPVQIPLLQLTAARADRMVERPPNPFGSWFEVDVALALAGRGYRLSAQVEVARKRIDLVVEGYEGLRLAVECDGDQWHGPDEYERDVFRQRQLERAGWRFVRVRESYFYTDPKKAIDIVADAAEEVGIVLVGGTVVPIGASAQVHVAQSFVEPSAEPSIPAEVDIELVPNAAQLTLLRTGTERHGPFTGYDGKDYPNPRTATVANVRQAVFEIVTLDGPLPKESIYRLYRDGCPKVERASKHLRHAVNSAVYFLERHGELVSRDEGARRQPSEVVVKARSQDWVVRRPAGARFLEDVPLSELADALREVAPADMPASCSDRSMAFRNVLQQYGFRRLTAEVLARLDMAQRFLAKTGELGLF
jgi:very-short-patch-repair endonuclease